MNRELTLLIADSGSTKTDWCMVRGGRTICEIKTGGTNPFFQTEEEIAGEIHSSLIDELPSADIDEVYFYGAGCTPEKLPVLEGALRRHLRIHSHCEVASDMLAAARSLCGHEPGIACILGTGSNSCAYDGERIVHNVSPLGFILGDEGSGAVLGKLLLGDVLKHQLPQPVIDRFNERYGLSNAEIIERVYRQKLPNRFLASFVPFLADEMGEPAIHSLVVKAFRSFLQRNVKQYDGWDRLPVGFVGSVAFYFRDVLREALEAEGRTLGRILQAPMDGLIEFHADHP